MMLRLCRPAVIFFLLLILPVTGGTLYARDPLHPNRLSLVTYGFGLKSDNGFTHLPRPHRVRAVIGTRFGTDYLFSGPAGRVVGFTKVWVYPHPIIDPQTGERSAQLNIDMSVYTNTRQYAGFILEYPQELVKGKWSLQFYYKGRMIHREDFELY